MEDHSWNKNKFRPKKCKRLLQIQMIQLKLFGLWIKIEVFEPGISFSLKYLSLSTLFQQCLSPSSAYIRIIAYMDWRRDLIQMRDKYFWDYNMAMFAYWLSIGFCVISIRLIWLGGCLLSLSILWAIDTIQGNHSFTITFMSPKVSISNHNSDM